jgi:aspartate carbamoyltransferase catalytic subunit
VDNSCTATNNSRLRHILTAAQFDRPFLDYLCNLTDAIRKFDKSKEGLLYLKSLLSHRRAMLYFTQPSTRTFLSFQSACEILGMAASEIREASVSSEIKGESIEDSLRTFSSYVDLIIMRSPVAGLCDRIAALLDKTDRPVPIINAGSGPDEHPTQALLDIYTLNRSFRRRGGIDNKRICFVGDLKRGRTVRSLSRLLCNYQNVELIFASPPEFAMAADLRGILQAAGQPFTETTDFASCLPEVDAVYMTRIQDEYDKTHGESSKVDTSSFKLKASMMSKLNKDAIIMHPMPRRDELDIAIDSDPRARYWRQERNGMWTRVAIITLLMGVDHQILLPEL